jgi:hypothetical protein
MVHQFLPESLGRGFAGAGRRGSGALRERAGAGVGNRGSRSEAARGQERGGAGVGARRRGSGWEQEQGGGAADDAGGLGKDTARRGFRKDVPAGSTASAASSAVIRARNRRCCRNRVLNFRTDRTELQSGDTDPACLVPGAGVSSWDAPRIRQKAHQMWCLFWQLERVLRLASPPAARFHASAMQESSASRAWDWRKFSALHHWHRPPASTTGILLRVGFPCPARWFLLHAVEGDLGYSS